MFALSKVFTDREGVPHRIALTGVPMGWTFSVGLIQQIQRFFLSQVGADSKQEIRPSQIFPDYIGKSIHSVYVDNFNDFRTVGVEESFEKMTS